MLSREYKNIRIVKIVFISFFLLLLFFPTIDYLTPLRISSEYDSTENRNLAVYPEFEYKHADAFPKQFEAYFNDNMNFREDLLNLNGFLGFKQNNNSSDLRVIEGKNGWYYSESHLGCYRNNKLFSESQIDSLREIFSYRNDWLEAHNIKGYFVIVPSKAYIYPEFLPSQVFKFQQRSRTDQLMDILKEFKTIRGIDLKPKVLAAKKEFPNYPLYYKTDQHWNQLGGFVGYREIMAEISKDFPEFDSLQISDYNIQEFDTLGYQLARFLRIENRVREKEIILTKKSLTPTVLLYNPNRYVPHPNFPYKNEFVYTFKSKEVKPKVLLIRDSFTNAFLPRLAEGVGFGEITLVWDNWCSKLNEEITTKEEAKIHLTVIIDANIPFILSHEPDKRK